MWDWFELVMVIFPVWFILIVIKKTRQKKGDLELFLFVVALAGNIVFLQLRLAPVDALYVDGFAFLAFLFSLLVFNPRLLKEKDSTKAKYDSLKKEHKELKEKSEVLRQRFVHLLDLFPEGIAFRSGDYIFGTDAYISLFGLDEHEFTVDEFFEHLHPDDRQAYRNALSKTSRKKPKYTTHYRVKEENGYRWIKEHGTRMDDEKETMYISIIQSLDVKRYPKTEVDVLNRLEFEPALLETVQSLNRKRSTYTLIFFELSNIPAINKRYGRDIGDLMMGKFLNKLVYHFLKDADMLFRLSGIRFAMLITDQRKFKMLKQSLEQGSELANFTMSFGQVKESVYPFFGIQTVDYFDEPVDELVERNHKALDIALDENTPENYFEIS